MPESYRPGGFEYTVETYFFEVSPGFHEVSHITPEQHMQFLYEIAAYLFRECILTIA